jgi:hypothetical protein
MFTRDALLASGWYQERLVTKQQRDVALWERHARSLTEFLASPGHREEAERLGIAERLEHSRAELERVSAPQYLTTLVGTIGADPVHRPGWGQRDRWTEGQGADRRTGGQADDGGQRDRGTEGQGADRRTSGRADGVKARRK